MRIFFACLLMGCTLMACAEIIPCGSDALVPQDETIAIRLEPGRVVTDVLLTFADFPTDHPVTLALPLTTQPRTLQVESIDEFSFYSQYIAVAREKLQLQSVLNEETPSRNIMLSFSLLELGPLNILFDPVFGLCKVRERARAASVAVVQPWPIRSIPINSQNLRTVQFLDHSGKLALVRSGVLPSSCIKQPVALINLTEVITEVEGGKANIHLHLEQAVPTKTAKTAIFPHGIATAWWKDIPSSGGYAGCPDNYQLQIYRPIINLLDNYWVSNGEVNQTVLTTSGISYRKIYSTPALFIDGNLDDDITLSLIPHMQHPALTAVAGWLLDSRHTLLIAILTFLAAWVISAVKVIKPAWQATGRQGFPLKLSLACMGIAFLVPFASGALLTLFIPDLWSSNAGFMFVEYSVSVIAVVILFLLSYICKRYYRRIFDTGRYFWRAWAVAMCVYVLLGAGFWALAYFAEQVAAG